VNRKPEHRGCGRNRSIWTSRSASSRRDGSLVQQDQYLPGIRSFWAATPLGRSLHGCSNDRPRVLPVMPTEEPKLVLPADGGSRRIATRRSLSLVGRYAGNILRRETRSEMALRIILGALLSRARAVVEAEEESSANQLPLKQQ